MNDDTNQLSKSGHRMVKSVIRKSHGGFINYEEDTPTIKINQPYVLLLQ